MIVLARSERWIVVAKPPWVVVHRSAEAPLAEAMLQRVRDHVGRHVFPIHRLDFQASGCLLFATDREAAGPLSAALTEGSKTYVALVRGRWTRGEAPLVVANPMKDDNDIPREASTTISCAGTSEDPRCSVLIAKPDTGRWHQVRRHARDLDHPIVGDTKHGDGRVNREWRERGMRRLALHCAALELADPDGGRISATCPLYDDMAAVFAALPFYEAVAAALPAVAQPPLARDPEEAAC